MISSKEVIKLTTIISIKAAIFGTVVSLFMC